METKKADSLLIDGIVGKFYCCPTFLYGLFDGKIKN